MSGGPTTIGMIGLGRMGANMTRPLLEGGHHVGGDKLVESTHGGSLQSTTAEAGDEASVGAS